MSKVKDRHEVKEMYDAMKEPVHFGTVRQLCHEKHSELPLDQQIYKGRAVFRGDTVKGAEGYLAVYSEQGPRRDSANARLRWWRQRVAQQSARGWAKETSSSIPG